MSAHRRDTSGETAQQNHRKEAHLKANCGRSLTRTTQQRQRRNEHEHDEGRRKTEVLEFGRISSARFSIFWKTFQPLFISFLFDLEQMWVHIFMSTDIIFDYLLPASQEDICNRIEWSKALRQGKYPSILLSLYLEMNKHYYDRMDVSSFSNTFGVKVIKEIFFSPHKLYVYCYRKLHLTSPDCFGSLSMATRFVFA